MAGFWAVLELFRRLWRLLLGLSNWLRRQVLGLLWGFLGGHFVLFDRDRQHACDMDVNIFSADDADESAFGSSLIFSGEVLGL